MARAETIESVRETGVGGNGPAPSPQLLPHPHAHLAQSPPHYCHHHWLWDWYRSGTGNRHHLQPLQALYLSYPLPYPHPEGQDEPQTHQQLPASLQSPPPPLPLGNRREVRGSGPTAPSALPGEQSELERGEHQEASRWQGPLPDLLHQIEHPSGPSPHHRAPRREGLQELEVRRLGSQLRAIGDEFNATVLRRAVSGGIVLACCATAAGLERRLPRTLQLHHPDSQHSLQAHIGRWLTCNHMHGDVLGLGHMLSDCGCGTESLRPVATQGRDVLNSDIRHLLEQRIWKDEMSSWRYWGHLWAGSPRNLCKLDFACLPA
ncbi:bcl-2-binding component 3 isoform X2 [Channa argus]